MRATVIGTALLLALAAPVRAGVAGPGQKNKDGPASLLSALDGDTAALAAGIRSLMLSFLPSPLYEDHSDWDQQRLVPDGIKWRGQGLNVHPERKYALKNDGLWWRVWFRAPRLAETLFVEVRDLSRPEPGRMLFIVIVWFDAEAEYERQRWNEGLRVWSGSVRARMQVKLALRCEATTRFEGNGTLLPDAVFRLRVVAAKLDYDHLEIIHLPGVGGDAAKVLGKAMTETVKQLHPSLERRLLEKADAAIVKAGDTKEVRISLKSLLGKLGK
jgi:hypothetical protein